MKRSPPWSPSLLWQIHFNGGLVDDWPDTCDPFTMRFSRPGLEADFVQHKIGELSSRLFIVGVGVLAVCASILVGALSEQNVGIEQSQASCAAGLVLEQRRYAVLCAVSAFSALIMLLTKASKLLERVGPFVLEVSAVSLLIATTLLVCYTDPYYMAKLHGLDPTVFVNAALSKDRQVFFQDTRLLLAIDTIVTVSHLLLPIRWCVLWPVDCVCLLAYGLMVAFLGSPEGGAHYNFAMLATLSLVAVFGKRRIECFERLFFGSHFDSLSEDNFEAEVAFSELSGSGQGQCAEKGAVLRRPADDECSVPSVPTTTHTGRMFAELERVDSEVRFKLEKIAEIGHQERWLIEASQVRLLPDAILGSGSFGVVVLASLHGSRVAVKVPKSSVHGSTAWHLPSLGNELRILRHVRHPNVVLFHGACIDPTSSELALVLEYVQGQRLDRYLESHSPNENARHTILIDICCALRYLHAQRPCVVHGDLKASNILVEDCLARPRPKLVDFGLSRLLTRKAKPLGGTLNWMAPELLQNPGMSPAPSADVFAFGRLAFFATTGVRPLADVDRRALVKMAKKARTPQLHWPPTAPFLEECKALVNRCLEIDAGLRPHMVQVHHQLATWKSKPPEKDMSDVTTCEPSSPAPEDSSMSWRSGLRMVRESLRPVPPNRPGGSAPAPTATGTQMLGSDSQWASSSESKPMRWDRPLPPPRPQTTMRSVRPALPKLPPVLEAEWESTPRHSKVPAPAPIQSAEQDGGDSTDSAAMLTQMVGAASTSTTPPRHATDRRQGPLRASMAPPVLVLPQFLETPMPMMEISIIDAIQRWNFPRSNCSCCVWHGALARLKEVQRGLRHRACDWGFALINDWQCPRCLHMDKLDDETSAAEKECDLCGYDPGFQNGMAEEGEEEGEEEEGEEEREEEQQDEEQPDEEEQAGSLQIGNEDEAAEEEEEEEEEHEEDDGADQSAVGLRKCDVDQCTADQKIRPMF